MKSGAAKSGIYHLVFPLAGLFHSLPYLYEVYIFHVWDTFINIKYVNYYIHRIFLVKFIPDVIEVKMFKLSNCLLLGLYNFHFLGEITRNFSRRANLVSSCLLRRKRDNFAGVRAKIEMPVRSYLWFSVAPRGRFIHGRHETKRSGMRDSLILRHDARGATRSLSRRKWTTAPPMGSPASPDCKWHYKSVGAVSCERGFARLHARRYSSILRGCSLRWLTRRKELFPRFKRVDPPRGVATRCEYRSGVSHAHVFIYRVFGLSSAKKNHK